MDEQEQSIAQNEEIAPPQKKKYAWLGKIALVLVMAFGIYSLFGLGDDDLKASDFATVMSGLNGGWLAVWLSVVVAILLLEGAKISVCAKIVINKFRFGLSLKTAMIGRYYDCVTPFAVGGQPMQIYELHKKGISGGNATGIVLMRYFGCMFAISVVSAVCLICNLHALDGDKYRTLLMVLGWLGFALNIAVPLFIVSFSVFPAFTKRMVKGVVHIGFRMHIVKDEQKTLGRAFKVAEDFIESFHLAVRKPWLLALLLVCCFSEVILTYAMPYFVMRALSCDVQGKFFLIMTLNIYATQGVSFMPTPGGSGLAEYVGKLAFSMVAGITLTWSVLFWRLSVYYIYILIGIVITLVQLIANAVHGKHTATPKDVPSDDRRTEDTASNDKQS